MYKIHIDARCSRFCLLLYQFPHFGDIVAGRRHAVFHMTRQQLLFNPRATLDRLLYQDMSSHAPVWARPAVSIRRLAWHAISIHAPRVGRDRACNMTQAELAEFQSTRPAWGATAADTPKRCRFTDFNPRAPRGARRSFTSG